MINTKYILLGIMVTALTAGCSNTRTKINAPSLNENNVIPAALTSANTSPTLLRAPRARPALTSLPLASARPASLPAPVNPLPLYTRQVPKATTLTPGKYPVGIKAGSDLISKQDLLEITVFKVPDLTREIRVGNNGGITYPLIGNVRAYGLTPSQLERQIEQRLGKDFMNNPQVTVVVKESTKNRVTVEGAVNKPGIFPVTGDMTVLQAIALAGGLAEKADTRRAVLLRRNMKGQISQQPIDIAAIRQGRMQDLMLLQDDRIVVPEGTYNRFTVNGSVTNPGVFDLREGMTVMQAITMAGGLTEKADKRQAVLFRRDHGGDFKRYTVNLRNIIEGREPDPQVGLDDRITVAEATFNRFTVAGSVKSPGVFDLREGMTVMQAITMAGGLTDKADKRQAVLFRRDHGGDFRRHTINLRNIIAGREVDPQVGLDDRIVLTEATFNRFTVAGSVNRPGVFDLREGMTFLQAIAMAGGLTELADRKQAILYRRDQSGNARRYIVNMKAIVEGGQVDPQIGMDDRIVLIDHKARKLLKDASQFISPIKLF